MKPDDILNALGGIDDQSLTDAMNYRKPKKILRISAVAACLLAVLVSIIYIRSQFGFTDGPCISENASDGSSSLNSSISDTSSPDPSEEGSHTDEYGGGAPLAPDSVEPEAEGYTIVSIFADGEAFSYEPAPLYAVTVRDNDMDDYVSEEFARDMTGIHIFTAGDEDPSGAPTWYAVTDGNGKISKIYWFSETETGYGRGYTDGNDPETALNVLAGYTSEENPMYLVRYSEMLFAVIGDTAYTLPGFTFKPESEILPYVNFAGMDVEVICIK